MDIPTSVTPRGLIIYLNGHLDAATAPEIEKDIILLITPSRPVVFDLSNVTYISSAGLRLFIIAFKQAARIGIPIAISSCPVAIQNLFDASGFSRMISCYKTNNEAFDAITQ